MSDREALAAALEIEDRFGIWDRKYPLEYPKVIVAAARERLAQLPGECGTCGGSGKVKKWRLDSGLPRGGVSDHQGREWPEICPSCHGSGKVYPAELVEQIGRVIYETNNYLRAGKWEKMYPRQQAPFLRQAIAALVALNRETP